MQRNRAANNLSSVDDKQPIGLIRNLLQRAQVVEHFRDCLRVAHDHDVLCHQAADRILIVVPGVLQPGPVLRLQRLGHLVEHILGGFAGEKGQVVGVERSRAVDQLLALQFLNERATNLLARLDQRRSRLRRLELPKHQQAIVCGQESRITAMSAGC